MLKQYLVILELFGGSGLAPLPAPLSFILAPDALSPRPSPSSLGPDACVCGLHLAEGLLGFGFGAGGGSGLLAGACVCWLELCLGVLGDLPVLKKIVSRLR
ncbi:MAG: hypothetical protein K8963_03325 [Proteobacteria bacterium]|nr:hypothetical protein [Pseudomonadota bacterium]